MIKVIDVAIVIKHMKNIIFNSFMLISLSQAKLLAKGNFDVRKMAEINKSYLRCHSDQTYEISHLNCHRSICLIQFSILEDVKGGSLKISRIRKQV